MKTYGITRRWLLNSLGIILLVLVTLIITLSFVVQGYIYNIIQSTVNGRAGELTNVFAGYSNATPREFSSGARTYVENSTGKEMMEMMVFNSSGKIMKNTKVTDGNDQKWTLGSGGKILTYGSNEVAEILAPEATVSY